LEISTSELFRDNFADAVEVLFVMTDSCWGILRQTEENLEKNVSKVRIESIVHCGVVMGSGTCSP